APSDQDAEVVQLKGRPGKQARAKRNSDDGDWPSTEWDDLSDADYWKEVASDKPLMTTARTAQPESRPDREVLPDVRPREMRQAPKPLPARQAQDAQTIMQASVPARGGQDFQRDHAPLPPADLPQRTAAEYGPGFLGAPPASVVQEPLMSGHYQPPAAASHTDRLTGAPSGRLPAAYPPPTAPPSVAPAPAAARPPLPQIYDDDPLTSPSFPRIVTSDSRSYRSSRSAAASPAPSAPPATRAADLPGYGGAPTAQFPRYGSVAPGPGGNPGPVNGSETGGYHLPPAAAGGAAETAPHSYSPNSGGLPATASDSYRSDSYGAAGQANGYGHTSQDLHHYSSPSQVNGYGQASQDAGYRSQVHDTQGHDAARYPSATPSPEATPATGNPYGSYVGTDSYASSSNDSYGSSDECDDYVSTDLPGYTPNLAASYAPEQRGGYLPSAENGQATSHASDPYERSAAAASFAQAPTASYEIPAAGSWYPGPGGATAESTRPASGAHHAPAALPGGGSLDQGYSNGYSIPPGYGPPAGYTGRHHDAPSYAPAGHDLPGSTPGYQPAGSYPAGRQDSAGYLPPDYYGREDPARR
ncbi:MAG: hypothetical protein ABJB47_22335, partial [Actinomycetota bacterium]